jgi:hypothetical protein
LFNGTAAEDLYGPEAIDNTQKQFDIHFLLARIEIRLFHTNEFYSKTPDKKIGRVLAAWDVQVYAKGVQPKS